MNRPNEIYKPVTIGILELSDVLSIRIEVWSGEGTVPYFHIIPNNGNEECCVCIYEHKYFSKTGTLSSKQLKILDNWLRQKSKLDTNNRGITNWEMIGFFWLGQGNPRINVPRNSIQPDYTKTI